MYRFECLQKKKIADYNLYYKFSFQNMTLAIQAKLGGAHWKLGSN